MLRIKRTGLFPGTLIILLLASAVIFIFFHSHILNAGKISFASGGDGLKSSFGTLYHIKYDSSYWHFEGMNYPFGESVFYTGNQTFLSNIFKLLFNLGVDLSGQVNGILNIWLLFSYVLCAVFIYLIFRELGLAEWYSIICALLISFLSPQWDRLSGHYNLAYAYSIPLAIYLMLRYSRRPGWGISVLFGICMIWLAGKHAYYILLIGVPWLLWSLTFYLKERQKSVDLRLFSQLMVQFIIPVGIFLLFTSLIDPVSDRTAYPWGFFRSTSLFKEVFLPIYRPYGVMLDWEGFRSMKYIGLVSSILFFGIPLRYLALWIWSGKKPLYFLSDHKYLNVLLWSGVLALLLSITEFNGSPVCKARR